jgi:two-component system invasion response regulator UvrY
MKKILIADDHPTMRKGVKLILNSAFNEIEFGDAATSAEVMRKINEENWDMIILDIDMPGRNGLEVLKDLKENKIKIPVLVFSFHPEKQIAVRALKAGASGYLTKDSAFEELTLAVTMILSGRKYITPSLVEHLASHLNDSAVKVPHELLSDREYQTLLLLAVGKTVSEIASELSLGVPTVSTYRARILEKMQMKNTAELVNYAIHNGLT